MKRRFCYCDAFLVKKPFKKSVQNEAETIKISRQKTTSFWISLFCILASVSGWFWRSFWPLGRVLAVLGRLLGALGGLLGVPWALLGVSWAFLGLLGAFWAHLGRILGDLGSILKGFREGLGGILVRSGPQNNMQPCQQCLQCAQFSSHLIFLTSSRQVASAGCAKRKQFLKFQSFQI